MRRGCHYLQSEGIVARHEFQVDGGRGWRGSMFDGEGEFWTLTAQVQVRVASGMELGA